ncbi:50S ribosomal protein L30 [Acidianus ambivalens]|uniref:Large ribosomal subunit protein uL30 n=1 Tax=Acidianus ambivalens TaxID=2283 RepID=A0A650CXQ7_ACIAM|nr:50S ribosomal protein L30 [Acidianus ambivalens]MQL54861.1 50S ribosomal protein L30 [Acidianus ambivalens]QGR22649.1 50S ribosomal protein L30 [Acidianus ambivalens]
MPKAVAIVRIRGYAHAPWKIQETLEMLRLPKVFNTMIYPYTESLKGMLIKVEPFITWGEISEDGLNALLNRLETCKGEKITEEYIKTKLSMDLNTFKTKLLSGELALNKLDNIFKLPIRLHPPSGGFKGKVNAPYKSKGEFGYRGLEINNLIKRMV